MSVDMRGVTQAWTDRIVEAGPTPKPEPLCDCYPSGFSPGDYEGPKEGMWPDCQRHSGEGHRFPQDSCPHCEQERLAIEEIEADYAYDSRREERG